MNHLVSSFTSSGSIKKNEHIQSTGPNTADVFMETVRGVKVVETNNGYGKANAAMSSANTWYVLEPEKFHNLRNAYSDQEIFELLTRKGVFPYDWLNDMERLNETQLPPTQSLITNTSPMRIMNTRGECGRISVEKLCEIITTYLSKRTPSNLQTYLGHPGT